jgi:poly(3-hydroxybutyrate) depolymerase
MRRGAAESVRVGVWPRTAEGHARRIVPLILFHGDNDHMVNRINAEQLAMQWALAHGADTDGAAQKPDETLRTRVIRGRAPAGHPYTRTIYYDEQEREVMEKWIIHQAGHAWVGSDLRGPYTDPLGPDASAEMVRFFMEHPLQ